MRPAKFGFNTETAESNPFQKNSFEEIEVIRKKVLEEFDEFVSALKTNGIDFIVFLDSKLPEKPDAIFPNNWISFHHDGTVVFYPLFAENRRREQGMGMSIIDALRKKFKIVTLRDMSELAEKGIFLEGTGSVVFDHSNRTAFASISPRTQSDSFAGLCQRLRYKPFWFHSFDRAGKAIYHTNVMMNISSKFAVVCFDCIQENEKEKVRKPLGESGREIIEISIEQMNAFAGNMLTVQNLIGQEVLILSQTALDSLDASQINRLSAYCELLPISIPTIEKIGGGSVRCMVAEIFLEEIL